MAKEYNFRFVDTKKQETQLKRNLSMRYLVLVLCILILLFFIQNFSGKWYFSAYFQGIFIAFILAVLIVPRLFIKKTVDNLTVKAQGIIKENHVEIRFPREDIQFAISEIDAVSVPSQTDFYSAILLKSGKKIELRPYNLKASGQLVDFLSDLKEKI